MAPTRRSSPRLPPRVAAVDATMRVVLLSGSELMLKRQIMDQLRAALQKAYGQVQIVLFDGKTVPLAEVLDELRTFSLMQNHKLVIVDEADQFVNQQTRPALERYTAAPLENATLVLRATGWRVGKLDKLIEKVGIKLKCDPLSVRQARQWLIKRSEKAYDCRLSLQTAEALVHRLGSDLGKLEGELGKLAVLAGASQRIDLNMVEQVAGRSSDQEAWAMQEAVLESLLGTGPAASAPAIARLHELVDLSGQPEMRVGYFVTDLARRLYQASVMKRQSLPQQQIASELRLFGSRLEAFNRLMEHLDEARIASLFDHAIEADARSKSGFGTLTLNLECFCARLTDL